MGGSILHGLFILSIDFNVLVWFYDRYLCFIIVYYFVHSYRKLVYNFLKIKSSVCLPGSAIEVNGITVYMAIYSSGGEVNLSQMCPPSNTAAEVW